jgi:hypothetical protein
MDTKHQVRKQVVSWREFLRRYVMPFPEVIERFRTHADGQLHVLNYDHCTAALLEIVCGILEVTPPDSSRTMIVNRSPTKQEAEILLYINRCLMTADTSPKDRKRLSRAVYQQMILRPAEERMRPVVTDDDLGVLERNNIHQLTYVNQFISNGTLSLYEGVVSTGEIVLNPPPEETRIAIDAILSAALSLVHHRECPSPPGNAKSS